MWWRPFFGRLWKVSKASVWTSCKDMLKHVWKILRWLSNGKHVLCVRQGQRAGGVGFLFEILVTSVGSGLSSSETLNSQGTKFGTILAWVTMCKVIFLRVWTSKSLHLLSLRTYFPERFPRGLQGPHFKKLLIWEDKFHPDAIDAHVRSCLDEVEAEDWTWLNGLGTNISLPQRHFWT